MKKLLFLFISVLFISCNSDSKEIEKAKTISEKWIKENVLHLYKENEKATLLTTKKDIEEQTNFDYIAKRYKWKGIFENDFDFGDNSSRSLHLKQMYDNYTTNVASSPISATNEQIELKDYLHDWTERASDILESSNCEFKISNLGSQYFYVIRFYIKYKDLSPDLKKEKYSYDRVDVILDENMKVLNQLQ